MVRFLWVLFHIMAMLWLCLGMITKGTFVSFFSVYRANTSSKIVGSVVFSSQWKWRMSISSSNWSEGWRGMWAPDRKCPIHGGALTRNEVLSLMAFCYMLQPARYPGCDVLWLSTPHFFEGSWNNCSRGVCRWLQASEQVCRMIRSSDPRKWMNHVPSLSSKNIWRCKLENGMSCLLPSAFR